MFELPMPNKRNMGNLREAIYSEALPLPTLPQTPQPQHTHKREFNSKFLVVRNEFLPYQYL